MKEGGNSRFIFLGRSHCAALTVFPALGLRKDDLCNRGRRRFRWSCPIRKFMTRERVFSGIQPSGGVTLGNYLGAIRNWERLQHQNYDCIYCMVDLHAITVWQDPKLLADQTRQVTAALLASGIDPNISIVFHQSAVPEHAQLAWILNCVARLGWLNRMTQFKEKAGKDREKVSLGLYAYPALQAADVLIYHAHQVPVGEDQKQHVELMRDIGQKFNHDFGVDFFPLPNAMIFGGSTRVMSLRDGRKKMSKSDPSEMSRINMTDDADAIAQKIRKAKTDAATLPGPEVVGDDGKISTEIEEARPEAFNLLRIYSTLSDRSMASILAEFEGKGFGDFKPALADLAIEKLGGISAEMRRLESDPAEIDRVLAEGAIKARRITAPILEEIYRIVGFLKA